MLFVPTRGSVALQVPLLLTYTLTDTIPVALFPVPRESRVKPVSDTDSVLVLVTASCITTTFVSPPVTVWFPGEFEPLPTDTGGLTRVEVGVTVAVAVGVEVKVEVDVFTGVWVAVELGVAVAVEVEVDVFTGVFVEVGLNCAVFVGVPVRVAVGLGVAVDVWLAVGLAVGVKVTVGVSVKV